MNPFFSWFGVLDLIKGETEVTEEGGGSANIGKHLSNLWKYLLLVSCWPKKKKRERTEIVGYEAKRQTLGNGGKFWEVKRQPRLQSSGVFLFLKKWAHKNVNYTIISNKSSQQIRRHADPRLLPVTLLSPLIKIPRELMVFGNNLLSASAQAGNCLQSEVCWALVLCTDKPA